MGADLDGESQDDAIRRAAGTDDYGQHIHHITHLPQHRGVAISPLRRGALTTTHSRHVGAQGPSTRYDSCLRHVGSRYTYYAP